MHSSAIAAVRALFDGIAEGDPDAVLAMLHPEVEWTPTVWSAAGTLRGPEGVRRWLAQFGDGIESLRIEIAEILGDRDRALALGTVFDSRGEGVFATRVGWTFELRNGLIWRAQSHESWGVARSAF